MRAALCLLVLVLVLVSIHVPGGTMECTEYPRALSDHHGVRRERFYIRCIWAALSRGRRAGVSIR